MFTAIKRVIWAYEAGPTGFGVINELPPKAEIYPCIISFAGLITVNRLIAMVKTKTLLIPDQ